MQVNISHNENHTLVSSPSYPNVVVKLDNYSRVTREVGGKPMESVKISSFMPYKPRCECSLNELTDMVKWALGGQINRDETKKKELMAAIQTLLEEYNVV